MKLHSKASNEPMWAQQQSISSITNIALVSKDHELEMMKDWYAISPCNVLYKCISESQYAFV